LKICDNTFSRILAVFCDTI